MVVVVLATSSMTIQSMSMEKSFVLALLEATVMAHIVQDVEVSNYRYSVPVICCHDYVVFRKSLPYVYPSHRNQPANRTCSTIGAGNIGDVGTPTTERKDQDIIPEIAIRPSQDGRDFHTGRGGAGNAQVGTPERKSEEDEKTTAKAPVGLADKLKSKLFGHKK
jgi:hypothetical protein